jgi:L-2-hydroxyglutarate oxidase LhgO
VDNGSNVSIRTLLQSTNQKYTVACGSTAYVSSTYRFKNDQWRKAAVVWPFAGFFNPILKNGSYSDLPLSIKPDNIFPMLWNKKNIPLTKYLIQQVRQSPKDRIDALKEYVPSAKSKDWIIERAGQRVQVIKR